MRITFVCPSDSPTGGMRVIALYAARLAARGHSVTAVIAAPRPPTVRDVVHQLLTRRRLQNRSKISHFANAPFAVNRLRKPGPIRDRDVPDGDVVIATWWETVEWMWALSPRKGIKVHFMQDYETWGGPAARVDAVYALPIPKIVIAQWEVDLLRSRWGQTALKHIPNSVDLDTFFAPERGKQPMPTVGVVYTEFRNKGCDLSLAAFAQARERIPSLRLIAFGTQWPSPDLPLPSGTEFHGDVPDNRLRDLYATCDAWLFGTRVEGFGLPILEAMACRTPVVGTPAGAAPELLSRGGGILVGREDAQGMADAIARIASMPDAEWRAMSQRALDTAASYTWDDATSLFEKALVDARQR